jgi:hypothetical protein
MTDRPTGIIRTLPTLYGDETGSKNFRESLKAVEEGDAGHFYVFLSQKPTVEVLHLYILIDGNIVCRTNIAGYRDGRVYGEMECWDGTKRTTRWMAICTAPISYPPEPIKMRGFQGFRYTQELW